MDYPVVCAPLLVEGRTAKARLADREVTVTAPPRLLRELFCLCDGRTPLREIKRSLGSRWRAQTVGPLVRALVQHGVIADANALVLQAWRYIENPRQVGAEPPAGIAEILPALASRNAEKRFAPRYFRPPRFKLRRHLEQRSSARSFSGKPVPLGSILAMLWAAYGVRPGRRGFIPLGKTVPSGGGIYPLRVVLIALRGTRGLDAGAYAMHYRGDGTVGFRSVPVSWRHIYRSFWDPGLLRNAHGVILVGGEVALSARKYGNRAALYIPLEAGHAVQNALLAATELRIAAVEIGGFLEAQLRRFFPASRKILPVTTIVFGNRAREAPARKPPEPATGFRWVDFDDGGYAPPFFLGMAGPEDRRRDADYCWGRSRDPLEAYDKTLAESVERSACTTPTDLYRAAYVDLDRALDPREVVAYDPRQYRTPRFPFAPFKETSLRWWKDGREYFSGKKISVPADLVYFGDEISARIRRPYTTATTSGVAAFRDRETALERAVLELCERDAFMRAWFSSVGTPRIAYRGLPGPIQKRLASLKAFGVRVAVKDLTRDLVPTVLVFAQHRARTFTVVGAGAAYDPESALDHALMEVEATVFMRLRQERAPRIRPEEVVYSSDHADLYAQPRYFTKADFLGAGPPGPRLRQSGAGTARSWAGLQARLRRRGFRLVSVDIAPKSPGTADEVAVVRALVPGLVPICFGFGTEPMGTLCRVLSPQQRPVPAPLFPHPFS